VAFEPHGAVGGIVMHWATRPVHRKLLGIDADAIALRIRVQEDACLQHLVRRVSAAAV